MVTRLASAFDDEGWFNFPGTLGLNLGEQPVGSPIDEIPERS
ncbi:hypothetical protein [Rhodoferax sp. PAMC 29310]|nr:hypothetical protein [Rhodoferax sp. PAMC 29310]